MQNSTADDVIGGAHYDKLPGQLQQKITWAFGQDILGNERGHGNERGQVTETNGVRSRKRTGPGLETNGERGQVLQANILPFNSSLEVPAADFKNWAGGFTMAV